MVERYVNWWPQPFAVSIVVLSLVLLILWGWILIEMFRAPKDRD